MTNHVLIVFTLLCLSGNLNMRLFLKVFSSESKSNLYTPSDTSFTYKNYLNLTNYFASKQEVISFFDFRPGDKVADIGAGNGAYEGVFSLLFDSISFYSQDIDRRKLNQKDHNKIIRKYTSMNPLHSQNSFQLILGNDSCTNLPDNHFNAIVIISAFHEFKNKTKMLKELHAKLRIDGKLFILDAKCTKKSHTSIKGNELVSLLQLNNFQLVNILYLSDHPYNFKSVFIKH